jgi:hypothetical protein
MNKCCHFAHKADIAARLAICQSCSFRVDNLCKKADRRIRFLAIENACPEAKWKAIKRELTERDKAILHRVKKAVKKAVEKAQPPTLTKQIVSFAKSMKKWAKSKFAMASKAVYEKRLSICQSCEFHDPSGWKGRGKCLKCGCCTSAKAKLKTEKCPLNKW